MNSKLAVSETNKLYLFEMRMLEHTIIDLVGFDLWKSVVNCTACSLPAKLRQELLLLLMSSLTLEP